MVQGSVVERTETGQGAVTALAMQPKGEQVLSGGTDGTIKAWAP